MGETASIVAVVLVVSVATALLALLPREGENVAVVFPPWVDRQSTEAHIWRAGGIVLSSYGAWVIVSGDSWDTMDFAWRDGPILAFDAARVQALCGPILDSNGQV